MRTARAKARERAREGKLKLKREERAVRSQERAHRSRCENERRELETLEFIQAVDRFKRRTMKVFPTWSDVLVILRDLGYQRVA